MDYGHIECLEYMLHYQSPPGRYHAPREIKPGFEEIEVIVSGYADFMKDGSPVRFGPGSSVWYQESEVVEVTADSKAPYETIVFAFGVSSPSDNTPPFYSEWESPASCESFCGKAFNSYQVGDVDIDFLAVCSYTRLAWEALQFQKRGRDSSQPFQLRHALEFIEDSFTRDLDMSEIAGVAGVSMSHLHLLFRKHCGTSPIQYILQLRLEDARELLANTNLSVKEICAAVGFNDMKNFCTAFKRRNKLTPTQYRHLTSGR